MNIFNSLGSNYSFSFAVKSMFSCGSIKDTQKLKKYLEKKYDGKAFLFYKGREAIQSALEIIDKTGSYVVVNGYTCLAVEKAVLNASYKIKYLDIDPKSLHFSAKTLEKAIRENLEIKVVMVQNTLGYPCEIAEIEKICQKNNIILIEDLAHSVGTHYKDGREVGTVGEYVALSFSQDKMIDGVSGGALIVRSDKFEIPKFRLKNISLAQSLKDRFYPTWSKKIRDFYPVGIGKCLHGCLRTFGWLNNPVITDNTKHILNDWYAKMINLSFKGVDENLSHRQNISKIYAEKLNSRFIINSQSDGFRPIYLRFPIITKNRESLINFLKDKGIYVSDIWYDAPVAPRKYQELVQYKTGLCPISEEISELILNLPTHQRVSRQAAVEISEAVNTWGEENEL